MSLPYKGHCEHLREGWCIACIAQRQTPEPNVLENQRKATDCEYEPGGDKSEKRVAESRTLRHRK